ncbi:glycosyltransferase family 4 protein [Demequina muriae]|uniref:D-inositol 3-phosphate glycosyltransferase n=1 Tax=Demequina muriae TaxID=3051664 RepID=A0ABT8GK03_9MICO|nr:glycosyltransferase family 4 protein [Demequina sp. EGI L300058]MDN4481763.1 glycosyltransferase family 4 protein [Demequina sp. EGI L300058]
MTARTLVHVVCTDAFAGVERHVLSTAVHQARHGHQVVVVGGSRSHLEPALEQAGAGWLPGSTLVEAWRSLRSLTGPQLLVTHMTAADALGGWWSLRTGAPVVSIRHFAAPRGGRPVTRALLRPLARRIRSQIAVSHYVADAIGAPSTVVHTGVAPSMTPSSPRENVALIVQRLEPEKDTATALRAWAQSGPPAGWTLLVAGDGSERAALERLAAPEPSVTFLGAIDNVPALMDRASLLLAPTPREGLGIAVLEAMAHGVAVVATDAGGHRETVGSVAGAALFPPGDSSSAALLIAELAAEAERRESYGDALARRQRDAFDRDVQTSALTRAILAAGGAHG